MKTVPLLLTQRLLLKGIEEQDTDVIIKLRSDPNIYKFFLSPHKITRSEHLNWFRTAYLKDSKRYDWIALKKHDCHNIIGLFGVKLNCCYEAEISYLLNVGSCGKGYATEAVNKMIQFCLCEWNVSIITANIHRLNVNSINFIEKLGFSIKDENKDFICYTISRRKIMKDRIRKIIKMAIEELNEQREVPLLCMPETLLMGTNAEIDSMEFVTLVSIIEELISDEFDKSIRIVSDRAFSREHSPFRSIGTLTAFVEELLKAE